LGIGLSKEDAAYPDLAEQIFHVCMEELLFEFWIRKSASEIHAFFGKLVQLHFPAWSAVW
jgi:hypothetical protein